MAHIKISHPHYPNPSIIEAIIEMHFDGFLNNDDLDKIILQSSKKHECKKDNIVFYSAVIEEKAMKISQEPTGQFRLRITRSQQVLVQVFSNRFSIHWLGKYQGWKSLEAEFLKLIFSIVENGVFLTMIL